MATVIEETIRLPLSITQSHIDRGIAGDCGACPIALAFKESAPGAFDVRVGRHYLRFRAIFDPTKHYAPFPVRARDFVWSFDDSPAHAKPFTFDLEIPAFLANLPGFLALRLGTPEAEEARVEAQPQANYSCPL